MPSDEHVPPTDDELAEWEGYDDNRLPHEVAFLADEAAPRLIVEVRRLREIAGVRANFTTEEFEEAWKHYLKIRRTIRRSDDDDEKSRLITEAMQLGRKYALPVATEKTLTLPNGTVVRAGDVLVEKDGFNQLIVRVTGIGESTFLGRAIGKKGQLGAVVGGEVERSHLADWRPWSEVYPDRPVPGKE